MIYCGWWQSRDPTSHHPNVVPGQDDGQPLHQLPGDLLLLLSQLSKELPCQLGEHVQGSPVPAPKGVHSQGDERDALCCATLIIFGHLDVERGLHPMLPIKSLSVNETT